MLEAGQGLPGMLVQIDGGGQENSDGRILFALPKPGISPSVSPGGTQGEKGPENHQKKAQEEPLR